MKNIRKLKNMDYSLLCGVDEIPSSKKGNFGAYEAYPYPTFHIVYNKKEVQIPIGLCGDFSGWCSKYEDIASYRKRVGRSREGYSPESFGYQKFYVCLYDPNCESPKFEDALTFIPAFIVHDIKGFTTDEEEQTLVNKSLKRFHLTNFGVYFDGMKGTSSDLYKYSYERKENAKECYEKSLSSSLNRAMMISQVLNKYDIEVQSPFAQDILTRMYENTFIMLDRAIAKTEEQLTKEGLYKVPSVLSPDAPKLKKPKLTDKIFNKVLKSKNVKQEKTAESDDISLSAYMEYCEEKFEAMEKGKQEMLEQRHQKEIEAEKAKDRDREKRVENFKL